MFSVVLVGTLEGLGLGVGVAAAHSAGLLDLVGDLDLDLDSVKEEDHLGGFDLNDIIGGPE